MKKIYLMLLPMMLLSCWGNPDPTPTPKPPPGKVCVPYETCGCWHQPPGEDWQYLGDCDPIDPPPPPPVLTCPFELPEDASRRMRFQYYGQGATSTPQVCAGNEWCLAHSGRNQNCCPPTKDGDTYELACNALILKQQCPMWEYNVGTGWKRCTSQPHPEASCDHFDHDDPKTTKYEGTNPNCLLDHNPVETGYFAIYHGTGKGRVCTKDGICSNALDFDH